jgi:hypothetical protein
MVVEHKTTKRVNLQLDPAVARKLKDLKRIHGGSTTALVKAAIERYHEATLGAAGDALRILTETGFIGCGEAEPTLSSDYKRFLTGGAER